MCRLRSGSLSIVRILDSDMGNVFSEYLIIIIRLRVKTHKLCCVMLFFLLSESVLSSVWFGLDFVRLELLYCLCLSLLKRLGFVLAKMVVLTVVSIRLIFVRVGYCFGFFWLCRVFSFDFLWVHCFRSMLSKIWFVFWLRPTDSSPRLSDCCWYCEK